jgi:hypothetical protein
MPENEGPARYVEAIRRRGLSIYESIEIGDPELWVPAQELEVLLNAGLVGVSLAGLPLRTRSKVLKEHICRVLGYPVPKTFKKTQPRFPGQLLDTYVQKSNNLQVWNEEIAPVRRYAIIRIDQDASITRVRVVTGEILANLDTTGTRTQKYQARIVPGRDQAELIARVDTDRLRRLVRAGVHLGGMHSPVEIPAAGQLMPIREIFERLRDLIGTRFVNKGHDQERNRGADLHRLVCQHLGYNNYRDDGQFPDIRHQLLEVKLQMSRTIDLGLVCPDATEPLDVPKLKRRQIRHCDVRYAVFYARADGASVELTHLFLTTGERFFARFQQFKGKVLNKKLQIPLPADFFTL